MTRHIKQVHNKKYPYTCDKCGHGVDRLSFLSTHKCGRVRREPDIKPVQMLIMPPAEQDAAKVHVKSEETPTKYIYDEKEEALFPIL